MGTENLRNTASCNHKTQYAYFYDKINTVTQLKPSTYLWNMIWNYFDVLCFISQQYKWYSYDMIRFVWQDAWESQYSNSTVLYDSAAAVHHPDVKTKLKARMQKVD